MGPEGEGVRGGDWRRAKERRGGEDPQHAIPTLATPWRLQSWPRFSSAALREVAAPTLGAHFTKVPPGTKNASFGNGRHHPRHTKWDPVPLARSAAQSPRHQTHAPTSPRRTGSRRHGRLSVQPHIRARPTVELPGPGLERSGRGGGNPMGLDIVAKPEPTKKRVQQILVNTGPCPQNTPKTIAAPQTTIVRWRLRGGDCFGSAFGTRTRVHQDLLNTDCFLFQRNEFGARVFLKLFETVGRRVAPLGPHHDSRPTLCPADPLRGHVPSPRESKEQGVCFSNSMSNPSD